MFLTLAGALPALRAADPVRRTEVSIRADQFFLNSEPTFPGRTYKGMKVEGLLMATVRPTLPASAM